MFIIVDKIVSSYLTHGLDLLHHSWTQLLDPDLHSCTSAVWTLLDSPRLAAHSITTITDYILLESKLPHGSIVHILQGHGQLVDKVLGPSGTSPAATTTKWISTTKEHVKDVHGVAGEASTAHASFLDGLLSALVIEPPLLRVGQHLVGQGDLLELVPSLRILVRMKFQR